VNNLTLTNFTVTATILQGGAGAAGSVTVIDGATNNTSAVTTGGFPIAVAVNQATNQIYVPSFSSNSVTVIDGATNNTSSVTAGSFPVAVAANPVTNKIYVANYFDNSVTVIDGATNNTSTVVAGTNPVALAVNPATNKIYVANSGSSTVTVIDGATNATSTVATGSGPRGVAVNPATNKVYVANYFDNTVTVIDGATNNTSTVTVGSFPYAAGVNPVTNQIYVANFGSGTVTVIDGTTNVASTVAAGTEPTAVAVNPTTNMVYVANYSGNTVTVIDGATNNTSTVTVGSSPYAVGVNPVTNQIYVVNEGSGSATGTVTLSSPGPPGGIAINLTSSDPSVQLPNGPTIVVLQNATVASFPITTAAVTSQTNVTLTASVNFSTSQLTLSVVPAPMLQGGVPVQTISRSSGTVTATLASALTVPGGNGGGTVSVAGVSDPSFDGTFVVLTGSGTTTLTWAQTGPNASSSGGSASTGISLNQSSVTGGNSVVGTVTLATVAPQSGATVTLQSSSNMAQVPGTITVPSGSATEIFSVTTLPVTTQQNATITASIAFAIADSSTPGAQESGNTVTITTTTTNSFTTGDTVVISGVGKAGYNGTFVITVLSGTTFTYTDSQSGLGNSGGGTAADLTSSQQAMLTITPPPPDLQLLFFNPPTVASGQVSTGTVTLTAPALTGGVIVFLASNSATVTVPSSVLVPAGSTSATFPARAATGVTATTAVQVNGTVVALATNTLTVIPAQTATLSEQLLLTGETNSTDFPVHGGPSNTAPFQSTLGSGDDTGFLTSIALSTPVSGATTSSYTFSTYLGGMSSFGQVRDVFVSSTGYVYACGVTMDGTLPTTTNAAQSAYGGGKDAFIAEFNSSGAVQYLSYLGGAGDDTCNSLTVDSSGNIYVMGSTTNSAAMGATNLTGTSGAFQTANAGGNDFFVAKINPTGTGATSRLLWLTLVGGVADDFANGRIAVNSAGVVAVSGTSQSTGPVPPVQTPPLPPDGFPNAGSQARPSLTGVGTMGVVATISADGSTLLSTTFLFGKVNGTNPGTPTTTTASGGLRVDIDNNIYVCGATNASDLPVSTGAFQPTLKGQQDGYVAIINYNGAITEVTYLGGTSMSTVQACKGITFDSEKNVVIAMPTDAADYPVTSTIPGGLVPGGQTHFAVTKLTTDLSTVVFSTLLGGSGSESADATRLVLDGSENLYFTLATTSGDFPVTANAVQGTFAGTAGGSNTNVVVVKLSADGSEILYGSYLGGTSNNSTTSVFYLLN